MKILSPTYYDSRKTHEVEFCPQETSSLMSPGSNRCHRAKFREWVLLRTVTTYPVLGNHLNTGPLDSLNFSLAIWSSSKWVSWRKTDMQACQDEDRPGQPGRTGGYHLWAPWLLENILRNRWWCRALVHRWLPSVIWTTSCSWSSLRKDGGRRVFYLTPTCRIAVQIQGKLWGGKIAPYHCLDAVSARQRSSALPMMVEWRMEPENPGKQTANWSSWTLIS